MKKQRKHYSPEEKVSILRRHLLEKDNNVRLNSATGYITPKDMLTGRQHELLAERDRKLGAARKQRQIRRSTSPKRSQ